MPFANLDLHIIRLLRSRTSWKIQNLNPVLYEVLVLLRIPFRLSWHVYIIRHSGGKTVWVLWGSLYWSYKLNKVWIKFHSLKQFPRQLTRDVVGALWNILFHLLIQNNDVYSSIVLLCLIRFYALNLIELLSIKILYFFKVLGLSRMDSNSICEV